MGKPSKKSATKVEVAPAAAATKPLKKGKRDAEEVTEKQVPAKKQKQNEAALKQAIDKKKTEAKTQKKNKKDETSSDDDSSEEEVKQVKPAAKKQVKKPVESSSEEDDSSDEEPKSKVSMKEVSAAAVAKNGSVAAQKKDESSDDSDSESDEEEETPAKVASKVAPAKVTNVSSKGKEDTSESESDDESDSDEQPKVAGAKKDGSSAEDSSEEETSESEEEDNVPKTPKNKGGDVEMADADSKKSNIKNAPKTASTPQIQSTGSKTLFMGNLSFSIEREDVENFFKDAGEIADVRFGSDSEGVFKGYGHVEFVTVEAAQKALKLNGQDLLGRQVKLDLARERGERGPASGNENSYQKGGRGQGQAQGQTIFVKGFDTSGGEEQVRSALEDHFGSCGDITRVSIPQDYEGGLKGIAYMDFTDSNGVSKALELDGSQLGDGTLTVDEAKPRDNSFGSGGGRGRGRSDGGGRFSGGRGRFGGGGRSGGRFGGDSGGRFGGRGRSGGDRGGRGRGGFSGRKTSFD